MDRPQPQDLVADVDRLVGGHAPIGNWRDTMRAPGFSSRFSLASRRRFTDVDSHKVTTVAFEMSAVNRSPSMNVARSATSPSRATVREISTSA